MCQSTRKQQKCREETHFDQLNGSESGNSDGSSDGPSGILMNYSHQYGRGDRLKCGGKQVLYSVFLSTSVKQIYFSPLNVHIYKEPTSKCSLFSFMVPCSVTLMGFNIIRFGSEGKDILQLVRQNIQEKIYSFKEMPWVYCFLKSVFLG